MNTSIINFDYKGNQISFMNGKDVMVNATQLAKPYNKRPAEYLRLPDTLTLMNAITRKYGIVENQLVTTSKGGNVSDMGKSHIVENQQGTWIHRLIAIDYCQWLDIDLKLWCTEKLDELARYGFTATQPTLEQMLDDPDLVISLATQLKQERNAKAMLQAENQLKDEQLCLQSQQLKLAAPKIQYVDNVLRSVNTYTATQLAKELGFTSGEALNKKLKEMRVQYKQSGQWLLYTDYSGKGYTKTKTESFTRNDGSIGTNTYTVWTEVGRAFLHSLFKDA